MADINVVNPGLVNVADQADGLTVVDQQITVGPSTNSGPVVQAADQADGRTVIDQQITVGPSTNSGPIVQAADQGDGLTVVDQPVTITPAMTAQRNVDGGFQGPSGDVAANTSPSQNSGPDINGGTYQPGGVPTDTQQNTIVGQIYGVGQPTNVYV